MPFYKALASDPVNDKLAVELTDRRGYDKMSDIEKMIGGDYAQLTNTNIRSFGWRGVTVTVKDRQSQQQKTILSDINGIVKAGELLALMGPS